MAIELFNWRFGKQLSEPRPLLLNPNSQFCSYNAKSYKASLPRKLLRPINIKVAKHCSDTHPNVHTICYIYVSGINSNVQDPHAEAQNQSSSSNSANVWNSQNRVGWLKLAPRKHKQQWENSAGVDTDADDDTRALKLLKSLIDKTSSLHKKTQSDQKPKLKAQNCTNRLATKELQQTPNESEF